MTNIFNISEVFDRETEVLAADENGIVCAVDGRGYQGNLCSLYRMDAVTGQAKKLLDLEGTRLGESFDTFDMADGWFYAISVGADYHVRVMQIEKKNYTVSKIHEIIPAGEVLRIFPVNEKNIIVLEEVPESKEIRKRYPKLRFQGGYGMITYILNMKTGRHTDLSEIAPLPVIMDAHLWHSGSKNAFLTLLCADEEDTKEGLYWISIDALTKPGSDEAKKLLPLLPQSETITSGGRKTQGQYLIARMPGDRDHIHRYYIDTAGDQPAVTEDMLIDQPSEGTLVCSSHGGHVWQLTENSQGMTMVKNLSGSAPDFSYPSADGTFKGGYLAGLAVTADYDTVTVRGEILYKEIQVIHDLSENKKLKVEGCCDLFEDQLVLRRSFLRI